MEQVIHPLEWYLLSAEAGVPVGVFIFSGTYKKIRPFTVNIRIIMLDIFDRLRDERYLLFPILSWKHEMNVYLLSWNDCANPHISLDILNWISSCNRSLILVRRRNVVLVLSILQVCCFWIFGGLFLSNFSNSTRMRRLYWLVWDIWFLVFIISHSENYFSLGGKCMKVLIVVDMQNDFCRWSIVCKKLLLMIDTAVETINHLMESILYSGYLWRRLSRYWGRPSSVKHH